MMFVAEKYEYTADKTFKVYSFISYGPKGAITSALAITT